MKRFALLTAAALTLSVAAPAFANDQLADSLGVDGAEYTTAQLIQLKAAYDEDDAARINALLKADTGVSASTKSVADSSSQLADSLGVAAGDFSRAELVALKSAMEEGDAARINALTSHAAASSGDTPEARLQLGYSVGLDAMTHSRAELVHEHES